MSNQDAWNKHAWRRETGWWDDLEVDTAHVSKNHGDVFEWLETVAPDPYEHDYVLYTDGSGCTEGWGGYAAVWERIDLQDNYRAPISSGTLVTATYGSTVQRSELNAFLDGVHAILTERSRAIIEQAKLIDDKTALFNIGTNGVLNQFTGPDRLSILWYTDRSNLAQALLHDENGEPLCARTKDRDLWLRWSFMAKHVCITPMCRARNVVDGQAACDALAGSARALLKSAKESLAASASKLYPLELWNSKQSQTAVF